MYNFSLITYKGNRFTRNLQKLVLHNFKLQRRNNKYATILALFEITIANCYIALCTLLEAFALI